MKQIKKVSKGILWTSYILQGIVIIVFLIGAFSNLLQTEMAINGAVEMGYPEASVVYLGIVLLFSTILYTIPKTTFIGGILLTAWLGGAIATHIIHKDSTLNILFPVIFGILVWLCIWLRNEKLRKMVLLKKKTE